MCGKYGHSVCPHNLLEVLQESLTFKGEHGPSWKVDAGLLGELGLHGKAQYLTTNFLELLLFCHDGGHENLCLISIEKHRHDKKSRRCCGQRVYHGKRMAKNGCQALEISSPID